MSIINATVKVIEDSSEPSGYRFETTDLPMGAENVLYFKNCKGNDKFHIAYKLDGFTGYSFPDPSNSDDKPLWVTHGNNARCPTQATPPWGQFDAIDRDDDNRTLIVENKNQSKIKFFYTLRIKDAAGHVIELDPGGENQNGGDKLLSLSHLVVAVGTAAVTLTALYSFGMLRFG